MKKIIYWFYFNCSGCFNGELFFPREQYAQQEEGKWSSEALTQLRYDVMQMFYHQYQYAMKSHIDSNTQVKVSLSRMVKTEDLLGKTKYDSAWCTHVNSFVFVPYSFVKRRKQ